MVRAGDRRDATKAFEFMSGQEEHHSVATMSRVLEVSRSGYYAWAARGPSQRTLHDSTLSTGIHRIHAYSRGTYGAPRIHAELASEGTPHRAQAGGSPDARKRPAGRESAQVDHHDRTGSCGGARS